MIYNLVQNKYFYAEDRKHAQCAVLFSSILLLYENHVFNLAYGKHKNNNDTSDRVLKDK